MAGALPGFIPPLIIGCALSPGCRDLARDLIFSKPPKVKDVPDTGPPGEWIDGRRRSRKYGPDGRPQTDLDKPHPGAPYPHVHDWPGGKREEPGRPYCPVP